MPAECSCNFHINGTCILIPHLLRVWITHCVPFISLSESRAIEQQGGYQFNISAVPNTFVFGEGGEPTNSNSFSGQSQYLLFVYIQFCIIDIIIILYYDPQCHYLSHPCLYIEMCVDSRSTGLFAHSVSFARSFFNEIVKSHFPSLRPKIVKLEIAR